jgi:hypothetical protein
LYNQALERVSARIHRTANTTWLCSTYNVSFTSHPRHHRLCHNGTGRHGHIDAVAISTLPITATTFQTSLFLNNIMKLSNLSLLALSASAVNSRFVEKHETDQVVLNTNEVERFLIELAPGDIKWVTEEDKWELRRVRIIRT